MLSQEESPSCLLYCGLDGIAQMDILCDGWSNPDDLKVG